MSTYQLEYILELESHLDFKSPPMAVNPSPPQSVSQEQNLFLNIGSSLVNPNSCNLTEDEILGSFCFLPIYKMGRELRKGSPLPYDGNIDRPQQVTDADEPPNVGNRDDSHGIRIDPYAKPSTGPY